MKKQPQTFNDGLCSIYKVSNTAPAGEYEQEGLVLRTGPLRYQERTVGLNRFWTAMQANARIDKVIRIQMTDIGPLDKVALEDGQSFDIKQIQRPPDVYPPVLDLSLQQMAVKTEIEAAIESGDANEA